MVITTLTTITTRVPEGWEDDLILAARHEMVMPKLVSMDWKWDKKKGDTINIRRMPNWESATKVHGTAATATAYEEYETQKIIIDQFSCTLAQTEEIAKIFIDAPYMAEQKKSMAYALNRVVETTLTARFDNLSQTVAGTALGSELTYADGVNGNQLLRQVAINADNGDVFLVISSLQEAAFKQQDIFINSLTAGSAGPERVSGATLGSSAMISGGKVVVSELLNSPASGQHDMALFHKRCFALVYAMKPKWYEVAQGPDFTTTCGYLQAFGTATISRYAETPGSIAATDNFGVYLPGV